MVLGVFIELPPEELARKAQKCDRAFATFPYCSNSGDTVPRIVVRTMDNDFVVGIGGPNDKVGAVPDGEETVMNFDATLQQIESDDFAVTLDLASGFRVFWEIARQQESVIALWEALALPNHRLALLERVEYLAFQTPDIQYQNPSDIALAVYLWLLTHKDSELAKKAAGLILQAPQCSWAGQAAHFFLKNNRALSEAPANTPTSVQSAGSLPEAAEPR
jgi:hypothetical protein